VVLSTGIAGAASGVLAEELGYGGLFALGALVSVLGAVFGSLGFVRAASARS
jgi:hypothetical protein